MSLSWLLNTSTGEWKSKCYVGRDHNECSSNLKTTSMCYFLYRILEITHSLTSVVLSLPEELTDDLHQAVTFVSQFLSWLGPKGTPLYLWILTYWCTRFLQESPASDWTDVGYGCDKVLHNWTQLIVEPTSFTTHVGFYIVLLNVVYISLYGESAVLKWM